MVSVLDALFGERYADFNVIDLTTSWAMVHFYPKYCYEDNPVVLMDWLVKAAIHPEWGVANIVTDLLVAITVTNISTKSLNNLCGLFKAAVSKKDTANAGIRLLLDWIRFTSQEKVCLPVCVVFSSVK